MRECAQQGRESVNIAKKPLYLVRFRDTSIFVRLLANSVNNVTKYLMGKNMSNMMYVSVTLNILI